MYCIGAGCLGSRHQSVAVEVAPIVESDGHVSLGHVGRGLICVYVYRDATQTHGAGGAEHPTGDFAAVGNEYPRDRDVGDVVHSRNTP